MIAAGACSPPDCSPRRTSSGRCGQSARGLRATCGLYAPCGVVPVSLLPPPRRLFRVDAARRREGTIFPPIPLLSSSANRSADRSPRNALRLAETSSISFALPAPLSSHALFHSAIAAWRTSQLSLAPRDELLPCHNVKYFWTAHRLRPSARNAFSTADCRRARSSSTAWSQP